MSKYDLRAAAKKNISKRKTAKREREGEKKRRYMTNLCRGIGANPCSVKCSHSEKALMLPSSLDSGYFT